jgi:phosphoglycolate phosphatase
LARLLVFDLDGTLVDSSRDIAAAANAALLRVVPEAAPIPLPAILSYVGEGARLLVERCLAHVGSDLPAEAVLPVYLECYAGRLLDTTRLYPGVAEALDSLRGPALAVLTNKPGDMSRAILDGLGVGGRFARVWGAGDVPARKPDPEGLLRLMDEVDVPADEAWMIGDSPTDVVAARGAGVRVAGVTWGFHPGALRQAHPDRLFDHPRELVTLAAG